MKQKSELLKIIDQLNQTNFKFLDKKEELLNSLIESLDTSPEPPEDNVKWLLSLKLNPSIISNLFCAAAKKGHLALVTLLATPDSLEPATNYNEAICGAAQNGHLDVVQYLMTLPGIDPIAGDSVAFRLAAYNGHLEVLQYLMTLPGTNPMAANNFAIQWAAKNGYLAVVNYLMTLPNIDPTACEDSAIKWAARNQHEEIAIILARNYYNPFEENIPQGKKEERVKFLMGLKGGEKLIKLFLAEANPKLINLLLKNSILGKDIGGLIIKAGLDSDLPPALTSS